MRRILLSLSLLAAAAHARSLAIEDFHVEITVESDGYVSVTETLKVAFHGSWNGIYRLIPYRYTYPSGLRATLHLEVEAITDGEGNGLWNERSREGGNVKLKIAVPGASDATRTVVIRYRSRNTIRAYDDADGGYGAHDELYWNVTGNGWPFPIRRASAVVTLPGGVPREAVRTAAFTGAYGSTGSDQGTEVLEDGRLRFATTRGLGPYEGLTIVVGFPPGHVQHPTRPSRRGGSSRRTGARCCRCSPPSRCSGSGTATGATRSSSRRSSPSSRRRSACGRARSGYSRTRASIRATSARASSISPRAATSTST
jgi:hypothetical protein